MVPQWFLPYAPLCALLSVIGLLIVAAFSFLHARRLKTIRRTWDTLTDSVDGRNLEKLISDILLENQNLKTELEGVKTRLETAETKLKGAKRYAGLVRYDAFDEVGGQQSFAFALYDDNGNGVVVTSQVGRTDCRVFGKQISGGKADMSLTVEEERAIQVAANLKGKARISP